MSFLIRVVPLLLLGRWGIQRVNRILFADQPIPDEVEDVMTLIFTHFKPRLGVLPLFSDEELQRLTMPVLLLIGAKDALRDATKIEARMAGLLPDLTAMIIPGAGHTLLNTTVQIMPFLTAADDG
jgi:pimeloyl-ACP methyl ester carboxylesterase